MKRNDYRRYTIHYIVKIVTIFYVVKYNMVDDTNTSTKKTIQLSDSFLSMNKTKKAGSRKKKKEKPTVAVEPNSLRKTLLGKIKQFQQNEKIKNKPPPDEENQFKGTLQESMEYLEKRREKMKEKKTKANGPRKNKTVKKPNMYKEGKNDSSNIHTQLYPHANSYPPLISIDLPSSFGTDLPFNNNDQCNFVGGMYPLAPPFAPPIAQPIAQPIASPIAQQIAPNIVSIEEPPNGCLKGGTKPTYRQYHNKTLKRQHVQHISSDGKTISNSNSKKSLSVKNHHKGRHNAKIRQKTRRTKISTFKLGKRGNNVSVLIKNNVTRRKVKREHGILKQKNMAEIKKYLYDRNLLRIGSIAPPDVLRTMYEQSILAGDITNVGMNTTLQNFLETATM